MFSRVIVLLPLVWMLTSCAVLGPSTSSRPDSLAAVSLIEQCQAQDQPQGQAASGIQLHCQPARFQLQWLDERGEAQGLRGRLLWAQSDDRSELLIEDFFGNVLAHCRQTGKRLEAESRYLDQDTPAGTGLLVADNWQNLVNQLLPGNLPVEPILQWLNQRQLQGQTSSPADLAISVGPHFRISNTGQDRLRILTTIQAPAGQPAFQQIDLLRTPRTPSTRPE